MYMCMCICMYVFVCVIVTTIEIMNLRESKKVHRVRGKEEKGKYNNNFKNIIKNDTVCL